MKAAITKLGGYGLGAISVAASAGGLRARLQLSKAKHRSLAGHPRIARFVASLVPFYQYDEARFFSADAAPDEVVAQRRADFARLSDLYRKRYASTLQLTAKATDLISDLQFTETYRVPFQFSRHVRRHLPVGAFMQSSSGVTTTDLDGNLFYDLTGSYGVNLFGYDFYKECIDRAVDRVRALGPVLGSYHPVVADNAARLARLSGMDEVSFHMSGTEAVMQAVRLARYHTRRSHLVRFCGAYHGWWGDVQPGVGNPAPAHETYTLKDMSEAALRVLRSRRDIACVLVNPVQIMHPNNAAPADSTLVDSTRQARLDRAAYADWLKQLRAVCTERGIVLIFDEVFVGFRLAPGGAQEYFGVQADLVTYGKTLGGGLPIGAVCGRKHLMKRFREDRPGRYLLCARHVQLAPLRHGGDERVSAAPRRTGDHARSTAISMKPGIAAPRRSIGACATPGCRYRWPICRRSGRSVTHGLPPTIGCSSTTCGRKAWR